MANARLLQAACAVTLLAAAPVFAQQTSTQPADTGAGNSVNAPVTHDSSAPNGATAKSNMAPAGKMGATTGSSNSAASGPQSMHRSAMNGRSSGSMRTDTSQNAAVNQLNDQSYRAAHSGQAFSAGGTGYSSGSGSMHDMSGGSAGSPAGSASGSGGGAGGSGGGSGK